MGKCNNCGQCVSLYKEIWEMSSFVTGELKQLIVKGFSNNKSGVKIYDRIFVGLFRTTSKEHA